MQLLEKFKWCVWLALVACVIFMLDSTTLMPVLVFPCPSLCGFHVTDRNLEEKPGTVRAYDLTPNATFSTKTLWNVWWPPNTTSPGTFVCPLGIFLLYVFIQHTFIEYLQVVRQHSIVTSECRLRQLHGLDSRPGFSTYELCALEWVTYHFMP